MLEEVSRFIESHKDDTDIFCLQEVKGDCINVVRNILPDFYDSFFEIQKAPNEEFAQATFIRKNLRCSKTETLLVDDVDKGVVLYTEIDLGGKTLHLCNIHGVAHPEKGDNPARLLQSQTIIDFMHGKEGLKIVGGDVNVSPDTKTYNMFIEQGYRELVKDFNIKTTRNHFAWDRFPDNPLYYSDYVYVSKDVPVKSLIVPDVEVSDHLPIILDF